MEEIEGDLEIEKLLSLSLAVGVLGTVGEPSLPAAAMFTSTPTAYNLHGRLLFIVLTFGVSDKLNGRTRNVRVCRQTSGVAQERQQYLQPV